LLRFASLGSGSKGNATIIQAGDTTLLLDCGFSLRELDKRLNVIGMSGEQLSAILVTHEHSDHCKGVGAVARKYRIPVYMTPGTHISRDYGELAFLRLIEGYKAFSVGRILVQPVAVPHDAREPAQFTFHVDDVKLGILTDLGCITPHVLHAYSHCDGLLLEANHDSKMLALGPYPPSLKARVGGDWGHLSNTQAADFIELAALPSLQQLVVGHISEKNNSLDLVKAALSQACDTISAVHYAQQHEGSLWFKLEVACPPT